MPFKKVKMSTSPRWPFGKVRNFFKSIWVDEPVEEKLVPAIVKLKKEPKATKPKKTKVKKAKSTTPKKKAKAKKK